MSDTVIIADIGGTNARFGIVDSDGIRNLEYLLCNDYADIVEATESYLKKIACPEKDRPSSALFALAGPVDGDLINFTNTPWSFRASTFQKQMGFKNFQVMNDFKAIAMAVPAIHPDLIEKVGGGDVIDCAPIGVIGPGTGLGVAYLNWNGSGYDVNPGEGGHVTMPAKIEREFEIFHQMKTKYHHISAERVCSGKGLENLYSAIKVLDRKFDLPDIDAPEISEKAINGSCDVCKESLDLMLSFLGRVSGNLALTLFAKGGIYIAGGIPSKLGDYFFQSDFLEEFQSKGRMKGLVQEIPVYLVKHDALGLLGLEQAAQRYLK